MREWRGAWIATVANIDWPSRKDLTTAEQKAELVALLDKAAALKLNAVIFQVRPACDALYASSLEPWSEYLTGRMGKPPEPFYDPLAFAIEEAHRRGLELHAWFNPYRARLLGSRSPAAENHISRTRPRLVREYGTYLWLDPGEKEVQDYSLSVVMDVVKRYDVDGVHFDDYFYPYKVKDASGQEADFPDDASWKRSGAGSRLSRDDWRRQNVNVFIERVYGSIKAAKPWVKFGVSPFGIWRPGYPEQIKGYDAYGKLYADSRKWLANGWLDYFVPQLYWAIAPADQSFPVLLKWWGRQNSKARHVLAGMDTTKTRSRWKPEEIVNQIRISRNVRGVSGHVHWNMKALMRGSGLTEALEAGAYQQPALVPVSGWLPRLRLGKPELNVSGGGSESRISWASGGDSRVWLWLLQTKSNGQWRAQVLPGATTGWPVAASPEVISLRAVDRNGNTGPAVVVQRKK
jgi:uncharacterized lipoprotein YddW (UPF0748 family)